MSEKDPREVDMWRSVISLLLIVLVVVFSRITAHVDGGAAWVLVVGLGVFLFIVASYNDEWD